MGVQLPTAFVKRMEQLLGDEFEAFMAAYDHTPHAGIRVNTLKIPVEDFKERSPFELRPIPWCPTGFYIPHGTKPGLHPYYHAGLYYVQEPSAMSPVELLNIAQGEAVLDLCAAPGGKSTQIAAKLQGSGVLVTNDISADRTKALAKNVELYGVRNAVVLNESPDRIADAFPHFFNKILIDAPCSGEGMFRKDEDMAKQWETHSVEKCVVMQRDILRVAASMLSDGGRIVYSTCTFAPEENEGMIAEFLEAHPDFNVVPVPSEAGFAPGHPEWMNEKIASAHPELRGTARLWPHLVEGEGHFIAILQHQGGGRVTSTADHTESGELAPYTNKNERILKIEAAYSHKKQHLPVKEALLPSVQGRRTTDEPKRTGKGMGGKSGKGKTTRGFDGNKSRMGKENAKSAVRFPHDVLESYHQFVQEQLEVSFAGYTVVYGDRIYQSPLASHRLDGLKVVRPGWFMGTDKNGRFVPSHPLAVALRPFEAVRSINLSSSDAEAIRYLKGETLSIPVERMELRNEVQPKGYTLVCIDGYSAGWGKWQDGMLKNEYPTGWRWTSV
ncbi:RsmB/NOP family class I SAM-dependent RNA methyltransferase [Paenibacillus polymyxa]|uniref:RsmB/NOP family class I SAM-dependent RNA methyltransferase n=1 Tax=Paenibacillus polymyxa TaxID=1406 RepID=UPI0025B6771E|nr:RsmB/NOP family class I SAM-dependent RNA methyltransferase [Paenibacillus polymyxa]MDN4085538.1 RsmB/NOP family class I SAM-dependent RNA methyltransferase [Paenibacillus polymyxa]MDN4087185.1 RsmB/NOP family class I SAM-dependent RNA methyltransferase [Paenibacillus polymyxa]MDN4108806.1 RsmB/NOP family class I SAM-dependent RNA methyltransferase [Paenibacillus polymyxa]